MITRIFSGPAGSEIRNSLNWYLTVCAKYHDTSFTLYSAVPEIDQIGTNLFNIYIKLDQNPSSTTHDQASLTHQRYYIVNVHLFIVC